MIDSLVVGVAKPDPAIFDHAAHEFGGIERSRIVYLGDSVTIDIAAATAAGLRPVLLDPYDDHIGAPFERIRAVEICSRWSFAALKQSTKTSCRYAYKRANCYRSLMFRP